jgi:hypothetical protein
MLADLLINDEEGAEWFQEDIARLNSVLATAGLAPHVEPRETDSYGIGTYGYGGLHYLRQCAAHLQYVRRLPPPWRPDQRAVEDPLYVRYGAESEQENADAPVGAFAKTSSRRFDHLIMHSDAEGYYIPQDFERVIIAGAESYGWIGSSFALARECERLAAALEIPPGLFKDGEDQEFWNAIEEASKSKKPSWSLFSKEAERPIWRTHPVASMMCAKLHNLATLSIRTGAVMVFH